jgi:transcriptional regulator with XRE-family HTH domain
VVLQAERIRGLLKAKHLQQNELVGVSRDELAQWLGGRDPGLDGLKRLAVALDATSDYLIGLGADFGGDYGLAATKMSFVYFDQDLKIKPEQKQRCRGVFRADEVLARNGAPRTAEEWKVVADMIDLGAPTPVMIGEAKKA